MLKSYSETSILHLSDEYLSNSGRITGNKRGNPVWLHPVWLHPVWLHPVWLQPVWLQPVWLHPVWLHPVWLHPVWLQPSRWIWHRNCLVSPRSGYRLEWRQRQTTSLSYSSSYIGKSVNVVYYYVRGWVCGKICQHRKNVAPLNWAEHRQCTRVPRE